MKKEAIKCWWNQKSDAMAWLNPDEPLTNGEIILCCCGTLVFLMLMGLVGTLELKWQ